ncbi:MAG: glutathione peroxidase [Parvularculaceae bacterium]|nr:MAG: glutathione peroxidase [Parvularculaceae bacterium]
MTSAYDFSATSIQGEEISLDRYRDKVAIIVNTASKCGFTPQYEGLEQLFRTYEAQGLTVLGFPSNQFAAQEPGDENEIAQFCSTSYDVTFPMFAKVDVNGASTHPLFKFLKSAKPGFAGTTAVKWNFTKFIVDRNGTPRRRYAPQDPPSLMRRQIEKLLAD